MTKAYIGDGVYVEWDGERLILTAEDGVRVTNRIVLETDVYRRLVDYASARFRMMVNERLRAERAKEGKP